MTTEPILQVDHLRKVFGDRRGATQTTAVDDISFVLAPGASLGVVGESGSGKTTLARIIVGLELPTSGAVAIEGRPLGEARPGSRERRRRAKQIQMVFQDPYTSLDPRQSVGRCLDEVLRLHTELDGAGRSVRVDELLSHVGLSARCIASLPSELSGGQRQRVAIARCLASQARIIVFDEAVSALDVSVQSQVLNLLADLREQIGLTYLFITHDLAVVRQVSEQVMVMRHGRCIEFGPTTEVLTRPTSDYTRQLLSSVPRPGWSPSKAVRHASGADARGT